MKTSFRIHSDTAEELLLGGVMVMIAGTIGVLRTLGMAHCDTLPQAWCIMGLDPGIFWWWVVIMTLSTIAVVVGGGTLGWRAYQRARERRRLHRLYRI